MSQYELIPYKVESVVRTIDEIPDGVKMIKAPEFWNDSQKGKGVVVAVIDTGCQIDHPDLKERIIGWKNVTNEGDPNDVTDWVGHGTHVAGTIAAAINGDGVVGVAPEVNLLILKVFKKVNIEGKERIIAETQDVINAINYCINGWTGPKVRIISMSLGSKEYDYAFHETIKSAIANNILVVCAAGNEGDISKGGDCSIKRNELSYPGAFNEVVEVGAVNLNKEFPCFTNTNLEIDLAAPGVEIWSTFPMNLNVKNQRSGYAKLTGTSMATPHVSGAAALIINKCEREFRRTLTEPEIYAQLIKHTFSLGYDKRYEGNGLLILDGLGKS